MYFLESQWFGVDIGGSLVKCVYFECPCANGSSQEESVGIAAMREFLKSNLTYGSSGEWGERERESVRDMVWLLWKW